MVIDQEYVLDAVVNDELPKLQVFRAGDSRVHVGEYHVH